MNDDVPCVPDTGASGTGSSPEIDDAARRFQRLDDELARLQDHRPGPARERRLMQLGAALMVLGPVWIVVEYFVSHTASSGLQQRDALVGAIFGLAFTLVGTGLFVRCSLGRLWRAGIAHLVETRDRPTD